MIKVSNILPLISISLFIFSCNINYLNTNISKSEIQTVSFSDYKESIRKKDLELLKNKKINKSEINMYITPNINEVNAFKLSSKNLNVRTKKFLIGSSKNNKNIFIIDKNDSLRELLPYSKDLNNSSSIRINNEKSFGSFESDTLIIKFKDISKLNELRKLYKFEIDYEFDGYYKISFDIENIDLSNINDLITRLNTKIPENIGNIEFSSISSLKIFKIYLDLLLNHIDLLKKVRVVESKSFEYIEAYLKMKRRQNDT